MSGPHLRVACFLGTRPEAIKLAPVIRALREHSGTPEVLVCSTGQHRQMLNQVLHYFDLRPDAELELMQPEQSLNGLSSALFAAIDAVLTRWMPAWTIVQGDTTTAMAAAMASFHRHVAVGHVEAGLRTYEPMHPFPEEVNRRVISLVARAHFCPTERARQAILREGVSAKDVVVTGNTVVDAMHQAARQLDGSKPPASLKSLMSKIEGQRLILVTGHRRESFGEGFARICRALLTLAQNRPDAAVVYPVHLNPQVRVAVDAVLYGQPNVHLLDPLDYPDFIWLMDRSHFILTDSGGVQEEAPCLGKPVLVMRETTERPEGVEAGNAALVGTDERRITHSAVQLLDDPLLYAQMSKSQNPYGDGRAAERIADWIISR